MADIAQILATGGTTVVGVAVGAGLTYWFGALNRRHQEAREDRTRWYEARLSAYVQFHQAALGAAMPLGEEHYRAATERLAEALSKITFVGSTEVMDAGREVLGMAEPQAADPSQFSMAITKFTIAARKDLGHPELATLTKRS